CRAGSPGRIILRRPLPHAGPLFGADRRVPGQQVLRPESYNPTLDRLTDKRPRRALRTVCTPAAPATASGTANGCARAGWRTPRPERGRLGHARQCVGVARANLLRERPGVALNMAPFTRHCSLGAQHKRTRQITKPPCLALEIR